MADKKKTTNPREVPRPSWSTRIADLIKPPQEFKPNPKRDRTYVPPAPFVKANPTFKTLEEAARAATQRAQELTKKNNVEYGGRVFRLGNGLYSYTGPFTNDDQIKVNIDGGVTGRGKNRRYDEEPHYSSPTIPQGSRNSAEYHSHARVPGYVSQYFSPPDSQKAFEQQIPSYLGTPTGEIVIYDPAKRKVHKYDPTTGQTTLIYDLDMRGK